MGASPVSLLRVRVNISAQWLIGRFVRVSHSKSDLTTVANRVRFISNLKRFTEPFEVCRGGSKIVQWTILARTYMLGSEGNSFLD
ncbi:hypothetical protein D2E16_12510 [Streptococcus suis]|nr:hypothetical protein D2E16_12510 [Streptococcus suis]